ncbi:MAG: hypothetical protein ABR509_05455 [Candidatus Limnocylindria bacterium]
MRLRVILSTLLAAGAALAIATTTVAGGNATATLDNGEPPEPPAGEPVVIGFTLLQHGVTPVSWPSAFVTATNVETGEQVRAEATAQGAEGHYVATLRFPTDGSWVWAIRTRDLEVTTTFAPIDVSPAGAAPTSATPAAETPMILGAAVALFAIALIALGSALALRSGRRGKVDRDEAPVPVRA